MASSSSGVRLGSRNSADRGCGVLRMWSCVSYDDGVCGLVPSLSASSVRDVQRGRLSPVGGGVLLFPSLVFIVLVRGCCLYTGVGRRGHVVRDRCPSILLVCANNAVNVVRGPRANTLRTFGFSRLRSGIPRLGQFGCHVSSCRFGPPVSSSSVRPTL